MISGQFLRSGALSLGLVLGLAACATGPRDISPAQQARDQEALLARQAALGGQVVPSNAANAPVNAGVPTNPSFPGAAPGTAISSTTAPVGASAAATFDPDALDNSVLARAEEAIAEAEQTPSGTGGDTSIFSAAPEPGAEPRPVIPRVAAFALRTSHVPGERQWRRNPLARSNLSDCSGFETPDLAQDRFLAEGGPERDRLRLDPDGDGFVCGFDPRALRAEAGR